MNNYTTLLNYIFGKIPLQTLLSILYLIPIMTCVGIVSYVSYHTGEESVNELTNKLMISTTERIQDYVRIHLETPQRIVAMNRQGIENSYLDPENWEAMRLHFFSQLKIHKEPTAIYFGSINGTYMLAAQDKTGIISPVNSYVGGGLHPSYLGQRRLYILDQQGKYVKIIPEQTKPSSYRNLLWFKTAQNQNENQQTWTSVYPYLYIPTAKISAVSPVYRNNKFIGVVGCDLILDHIGLYLQKLQFSPSGKLFIIERSGDIIATSTNEKPFIRIVKDNKTGKNIKLIRLSATKSSNPIISRTAKVLFERWGDLHKIRQATSFEFNGSNDQRYFSHIYPYQDEYGLDWLIVAVLPESDFLDKIHANLNITLIFSAITLFIFVGLSMVLAHWIIKPIKHLNTAAKKLSKDGFNSLDLDLDLKLKLILNRRDEIGQLGESFQTIARELALSFIGIQTALQESQDKFTKIFHSSPDPILIHQIINPNIHGCILLDVNPSFLLFSGYSELELIGYSFDNLPLIYNHEQGLLLKEQLKNQGYVRNLEFDWLIKSEEVKTSLLSCEPIVIDNKDCVISIIKDITDRKKAEENLRQSEERFRTAFENAGSGMALVSLNGYFIRVNRALCEILGYDSPDLLTKNVTEIITGEELPKDFDLAYQFLSGQISNYQVEKSCLHKSGKIIWVLLNVSLLSDSNRNPLYFIWQIQDISERHEVEQLKNEFVSVVSHEVRTPLTAIKGALEILATGILVDEPQEAEQMLKIAVSNSERLLRLVNNILNLEMLDSGKMRLNLELCDINIMVKKAMETVQPIAQQKNMEISYSKLDVHNSKILADEETIIQVLTNLLSNSVKFSHAGTKVEIYTKMGDKEIIIAVKDYGKGIPPDKLETIFERFEQVDVSDSRQKGGTGLGLAICKNIVEKHQGKIWVESILDSGSTFYFTLPL
ncbi:PAS domain S-box protein [Cylindrospermopsis raciborskii]|uniref:PAS domain S-box protein n=1 Tax=Cylindrospermopsis raciborskii TaxID=77022 RepID=UPI0009EF0959|nr:PAS domain S-box protein [Cylindrospermopsis raciborskii]MCZ2201723.1 PAS domain S-box protein [Cylindrospermopsis raciborskii PAMP2012]MCZ2204978.1 PAS domain S-box protein [Cylindrospermopsis raciborskii PAMP2011]